MGHVVKLTDENQWSKFWKTKKRRFRTRWLQVVMRDVREIRAANSREANEDKIKWMRIYKEGMARRKETQDLWNNITKSCVYLSITRCFTNKFQLRSLKWNTSSCIHLFYISYSFLFRRSEIIYMNCIIVSFIVTCLYFTILLL